MGRVDRMIGQIQEERVILVLAQETDRFVGEVLRSG
jgi:hypothetical protein